jgi:hypothetical protein
VTHPRINPSFIGKITADQWNGRRVVAFGDVHVDGAIPEEKVWRLANPAADGQALFDKGLHTEELVDGLAFVLAETLSEQDSAAVAEIQKILIYLHFKYVHCPKDSLSTADVLGVREEALPDVIREITQLRNYPWIMSSPIVDKLSNERLGLPMLAVLPGPSKNEVLPRLKELREHCLIVCLARTLRDCLNAGVTPDIVIQLDTFQVQRHFYEDLPDMSDSLLVPLSICPFYPYAHKFRGVVMMDSFNMGLLPNPARLRESYISSLTACLGVAEVLHSSEAFLAGVNLSDPLSIPEHPYKGKTDGPLPLFSSGIEYFLEARDGKPVQAKDYFISTAREADQFAVEIRATSGTQFYSITDTTLLSRQQFPYIPIEKILSLPTVDRDGFVASADKILAMREDINITKTRMKVLRELDEMRQIESAFNSGAVAVDALESHMFTKAAAKMRNPRLNGKVNAVGVAAKVSTRWRESLNDVRLLVQAITQTKRGKPLSLLCLEGEVEAMKAVLGRIIQGSACEVGIMSTIVSASFEGAETVHINDAYSWLDGQAVVFGSPGVLKNFSYVMDYAPDDNVYDMRNIIGQGE